jgi:hypothetical protein
VSSPYDAVLLESENVEVPIRIEGRHVAIDPRLRELLDGHHSYEQRELQALNHAISALRGSPSERKRALGGPSPEQSLLESISLYFGPVSRIEHPASSWELQHRLRRNGWSTRTFDEHSPFAGEHPAEQTRDVQ